MTRRNARPQPPKTPDRAQRRLRTFRAEIDRIDSAVLDLLARRTALALALGKLKRAAGLPLRAPARERFVLGQVKRGARAPLAPEAAARIFRTIMTETLAAEERPARERGR